MVRLHGSLYFVILILLVSIAVLADSPKTLINYQGNLVDSGGNPVSDDVYSIRFSIWDDPTTGSELWYETQSVNVVGGFFSVALGSVTELPADILTAYADVDSFQIYLEIKIGADSPVSPRTRLTAVPYSTASQRIRGDVSTEPGKIDVGAEMEIINDIEKSSIILTENGSVLQKRAIQDAFASIVFRDIWGETLAIITALEFDVTDPGGFDKSANRFYDDRSKLMFDDTLGETLAAYSSRGLAVNDTDGDPGVDVEVTDQGGQITIVDYDDGNVPTMGEKRLPEHYRGILFEDTLGETLMCYAPWGIAFPDGSELTSATGSGSDNDWVKTGNALVTYGEWGIARKNSILIGTGDSTHVNLGVACTTSTAKYVTISGGHVNFAEGLGAVISGGASNHTSAPYAVIGGGYNNSVTGYVGSTVCGGYNNTALDSSSAICGGQDNIASGAYSFIGSGTINTASGLNSIIGGGHSNIASGQYSTIAGGSYNEIRGACGAIGGGISNTIDTFPDVTISGGVSNEAEGNYSSIGGGYNNSTSGFSAVVSGGWGVTASGIYASVGGGYSNEASGDASVVAGGYSNTADYSNCSILGGQSNQASGEFSILGGGRSNYVGGFSAVLCGGDHNYVNGGYSSIIGGLYDTINTAAMYSLAVGRSVLIDSANRVILYNASYPGYLGINRDYHSGGVSYPIHVGTTSSNGNGAYLTPGGTWTDGSSKAIRGSSQLLDGQEILEKINQLPLGKWEYAQTGERHISPYAEDFNEQFQVGALSAEGIRDTRHLAASDVAGVALAGVQELYRMIQRQQTLTEALQESRDQLAQQSEEISSLKQQMTQLEALVEVILAKNNQTESDLADLTTKNTSDGSNRR